MTKALSDDIFDSVHHSINALQSLQNSHETFVMERGGIDERLFEELDNCERLIKRFEEVFLETLREDINSASRAAVINTSNFEKAKEMVDGIDNLIGAFDRMESEFITRAQSLKNFAHQLRNTLASVQKDMQSKVKFQEKHKKIIDTPVIGPRAAT